MTACPRCGSALFELRLWPGRAAGPGRELAVTDLTCKSCGQGYIASTFGSVCLHAAGAVAAVLLMALQIPVIMWAGRMWVGPALQAIFAGDHGAALLPALTFLLFAAGVFSLGVVGFVLVSQALAATAWRLGAFRPEGAEGVDEAVSHRVRVEHRGEPCLRGYRNEEVRVDGQVVGPSTPTGQLAFRGSQSWYRIREGDEEVEYYLRSWGTGPDIAHVLFRNGVLWSEKRSGGLSAALLGGVAAAAAVEMIGGAAFDTSDVPMSILAGGAALGVLAGVALEPRLRERTRKARAAPPGVWSALGAEPQGARVLRAENEGLRTAG